MLSVLNQFRRIYNDDGRNDQSFEQQAWQLKRSLAKLQSAIDMVVVKSQNLHDLLPSSLIKPKPH